MQDLVANAESFSGLSWDHRIIILFSNLEMGCLNSGSDSFTCLSSLRDIEAKKWGDGKEAATEGIEK